MSADVSITNSRFLVKRFLSQNLAKCFQGLSSKCVLDVGCGRKPYKQFFPNSTFYVGIDLRAPSPEIRGVGECLSFKQEVFDCVICTQVLEHVESPVRLLNELNYVLTENGVIILSTHGLWIEGHEKIDYWRWTLQGLRKIFEESGFKIVESYSMQSCPSLFQFVSLYIPTSGLGMPLQVLVNLCGLFSKGLGDKGPNLPIVHIIKAKKVIEKKKQD